MRTEEEVQAMLDHVRDEEAAGNTEDSAVVEAVEQALAWVLGEDDVGDLLYRARPLTYHQARMRIAAEVELEEKHRKHRIDS